MLKQSFLYLLSVGFIFLFSQGLILGEEVRFTRVGEWGSGDYQHVFIKGSYAYCAASGAGLDIIDISNPKKPFKVGNCDTPGDAWRVFVSGRYAYVADYYEGLQIIDISNPFSPRSTLGANQVPFGDYTITDVYVCGNYAYAAAQSRGLQVIDISDPSSPVLVGYFGLKKYANGVYVKGNYAYVACDGRGDGFSYFQIIDISNPSSPVLVGDYVTSDYYYQENVIVHGNYAYVACTNIQGNVYYGSLLVLDISNPASPTFVGHFDTSTAWARDVFIRGNYAYLANVEGGVQVIDISNPSQPTLSGSYDTSGNTNGVYVDGNYAYAADTWKGLQVIDISTPSSPKLTGSYNVSGRAVGVYINGNYAYIVKGLNGLKIIDISTPTSPTLAGEFNIPTRRANHVFVKGKYAYVACQGENQSGRLMIIDISTPSSPFLAGEVDTLDMTLDVYVSGNYAYTASRFLGLQRIDISNPSAPVLLDNFYDYGVVSNVYVQGKYAYALAMDFYLSDSLLVFDISDPTSLSVPGYLWQENYGNFYGLEDVFVKGSYAYVAASSGLHIVNIADPSSPSPIGFVEGVKGTSVFVKDEYAYVAVEETGLMAFNISSPSAPVLVGDYTGSGSRPADVFADGQYVYLADGDSGKLFILQSWIPGISPQINLDQAEIFFSSTRNGITTGAQSFLIENGGEETLNWSVSVDQNWLHCSPTTGTDSGFIAVSVDSAGLSPGSYYGTITVSDPHALNSPQTVKITLTVLGGKVGMHPFGEFGTPVDGRVVSGSIPVTGWALDDIGVQSVQIFREQNGGLIYIGDSVFVEGARPDVGQAYPAYPNNYKAGWGYMMLTNFLPGGGNGAFKIYAIATDLEGSQVTLGTRTIICDNANAVKPFGVIDTPTQGGAASGSNFINFGWVLTPLPNTIPMDGSTIRIWVDGVPLGKPVYNQYRKDIAGLFPDCNNSNGGGGYFSLDTTPYENGVHTIQWTAADDVGNTDGIGSRYFTIQNTGSNIKSTTHSAGRTEGRDGAAPQTYYKWPPNDINDISAPVKIKKGYNKDIKSQEILPDEKGIINIEIKELEHLEIHFFDGEKSTLINITPLPIGSTLDVEQGIFYWSPGPGFVGYYRLVFIESDPFRNKKMKEVSITIGPKF